MAVHPDPTPDRAQRARCTEHQGGLGLWDVNCVRCVSLYWDLFHDELFVSRFVYDVNMDGVKKFYEAEIAELNAEIARLKAGVRPPKVTTSGTTYTWTSATAPIPEGAPMSTGVVYPHFAFKPLGDF